jgi:hypothetical protein
MPDRPPKPPATPNVVWVPIDEEPASSKASPNVPTSRPKAIWRKPELGSVGKERSSAVPGHRSSPVVEWEPIEQLPASSKGPDRPSPVLSKNRELLSGENIRFQMEAHELPGTVHFFDGTSGARVSRRAIKEDWHGAPVIVFPTSYGDSLIIGPSLERADRHRPEICQDRASFEYGRDQKLKAFAIADGVSQGMASASVADKLVQLTTKLLGSINERIGTRRLSKPDVDRVLGMVQDITGRLDVTNE